MWMSISAPFARRSPTACSESSMTIVTSAAAGATTRLPVGSMATPSPIIFCENISSLTSLMSMTLPSATAAKERDFSVPTASSVASDAGAARSASKRSRTCGTERPTMTWNACPFRTRPCAPARVKTATGYTRSGSSTVTRRRVAQFVTSLMFAGPPSPSRNTFAFTSRSSSFISGAASAAAPAASACFAL